MLENDPVLKKHVAFMGFTMSPCPYVKACDAVIVPSAKETASRILQEAMACGKPVVVTQSIEVFQFLRPSEDVLTFIPENADSLRDAMFLLLDANLRKQIGELARARTDFYDIKSYIPALLKYYGQLLRMFNKHSPAWFQS